MTAPHGLALDNAIIVENAEAGKIVGLLLPQDGDLDSTIYSGWAPGLVHGTLSGDMNRSMNPGNYGIDPLGPAESENKGSGGGWGGPKNYCLHFGQFYDEDGLVTFYEKIDDKAYLMVDGENLWMTTGIGLPYQIPILGVADGLILNLRMSNGGGGWGRNNGPMGFGFDPTGQATSISYQDYSLPP